MNLTKEFVNELLMHYFEKEVTSLFINEEADCDCCCEVLINHSCVRDLAYEPTFTFKGYDCLVKAGATKMVIIVEGYDEVIKFGFDGEYVLYEPNPDEFLIDYEKDICCYRFDMDFIQEENKFYNLASDNLKNILLPNNFLMNFGTLKIYTQQKISKTYSDVYSEKRKTILKKDEDTVNKWNRSRISHGYRNVLPEAPFVMDIITYYGVASKNILEELDICDLHNDNYGYLNNRPVIFDYATKV